MGLSLGLSTYCSDDFFGGLKQRSKRYEIRHSGKASIEYGTRMWSEMNVSQPRVIWEALNCPASVKSAQESASVWSVSFLTDLGFKSIAKLCIIRGYKISTFPCVYILSTYCSAATWTDEGRKVAAERRPGLSVCDITRHSKRHGLRALHVPRIYLIRKHAGALINIKLFLLVSTTLTSSHRVISPTHHDTLLPLYRSILSSPTSFKLQEARPCCDEVS